VQPHLANQLDTHLHIGKDFSPVIDGARLFRRRRLKVVLLVILVNISHKYLNNKCAIARFVNQDKQKKAVAGWILSSSSVGCPI
jgi:hypothetical protein